MTDQVPVEIENYDEPWDRWFDNRIYPSPDGLAIFVREITARRRADDELRANQRAAEGRRAVLEAIASGTPLAGRLEMLVRLIEVESPGTLGSILLLDPDGVHMRHGAAPSLRASYIAAVDGEPIGPVAGSCGTAAYRTRW